MSSSANKTKKTQQTNHGDDITSTALYLNRKMCVSQSSCSELAAEAEASREARAKVIAAEGEQKASNALKEAADILTHSPAALQLRYLQTLNTISAENNSTIIFPMPIDLLREFMK